jgi:hypothetical protein
MLRAFLLLFLFKRLAVDALANRGIAFVSADLDGIQRTIILRAAMIAALFHRAMNRFIRSALIIHKRSLLHSEVGNSMPVTA